MSFRHLALYSLAFLLSLAIPAAVMVGMIPEGRERLATIVEQIGDRFDGVIYQKSLTFKGFSILNDTDIAPALPYDRSVFWWWTNQPSIEGELGKNPLIRTAKVERCEWWSWSCFEITVEERLPSLVALVGEKGWIIGEDGGFITPIPQEKIASATVPGPGGERVKLPVVRGLHADEGGFPNLIRARFGAVREALQQIEERSGKKIEDVTVRPNGEMVVRFRGLPMSATFDSGVEEPQRIGREAERFVQVLREFTGREQELESVDLAFDKLAVVKVRGK